MTKASLVEGYAVRFALTKKEAERQIEWLFETIGLAVQAHGRFAYPDFGVWTVRSRKARKIRNPANNEIMQLKASKTIGFRPAKELKEKL